MNYVWWIHGWLLGLTGYLSLVSLGMIGGRSMVAFVAMVLMSIAGTRAFAREQMFLRLMKQGQEAFDDLKLPDGRVTEEDLRGVMAEMGLDPTLIEAAMAEVDIDAMNFGLPDPDPDPGAVIVRPDPATGQVVVPDEVPQ